MCVTPGVTDPGLAAEPLATEGEATPGADDENPYDALVEDEREWSPEDEDLVSHLDAMASDGLIADEPGWPEDNGPLGRMDFPEEPDFGWMIE